jgi:hypothetical protein
MKHDPHLVEWVGLCPLKADIAPDGFPDCPTDKKLLFARPPVLSAARVRENWFFVSPSMCRAYQEPARASTALFAAVFAALVACDGQGFLRLNPSDVMTAHLDLAPA